MTRSRPWPAATLLVALLIACSAPGPVTSPPPVEAAPSAGAPLGAPCGPSAGACDEAGYCAFAADAACGDGGDGTCAERPRGCKRDCPGVCGCDGRFYCNACVARARGVSVRHPGRCDADDPPEPAPASPEETVR